MADAGNPDSRISLFFDAPTQSDTVSGVALSGYAGQHWLKTFGLQPDDFSSSHLIRCYGPGAVAMPLLYDSARHCRRHDRTDSLPTTSVYTFSLSQGLAVPAYRRLIQLDVQKARRLAARGHHVAVRFGRACFQFDCPQEWAIDSDMRRWRGHVRSAHMAFEDWFPTCHRSESALRALLRDTTGPIGLDLEYQPDLTPTILGLAFYDNGNLACGATSWNPYLAADVVDSGRPLVAYSAFEADAGVLSGALGVSIPPTRWIDALQLHWMNNRDLMDVPRDEDQGTSLQLMGLWTAASIVLDVPNWKRCRGLACEGRFCRAHDALGYCAMDAAAGLAIWKHYQ